MNLLKKAKCHYCKMAYILSSNKMYEDFKTINFYVGRSLRSSDTTYSNLNLQTKL